MNKPLLLVLFLTLTACTVTHKALDDDTPSLEAEERRIISALLQQEATHPARPRPILVLTPTDPWLPANNESKDAALHDGDRDQFDEHVEETKAALEDLRRLNRSTASLRDIALPKGAVLFSAAEYKRVSASKREFRRFVRQLGGVEPLVLSVSRPASGPNDSFVVLHVHSTWSGCGGVNLYRVSAANHVELAQVLVFW
jgi:hypothetical protein